MVKSLSRKGSVKFSIVIVPLPLKCICVAVGSVLATLTDFPYFSLSDYYIHDFGIIVATWKVHLRALASEDLKENGRQR